MPGDVPDTPTARSQLRQQLITDRERFVAGPDAASAQAAVAARLDAVLHQLEPDCLGSYWPIRSEFTPSVLQYAAKGLALPYAYKAARRMEYRRWDGQAPALLDECGIATTGGEPVLPDVVLVPCVGYTDALFRLGYGAGYFDAWLAQHPEVVSVGVAWSIGRLDADAFSPGAHDVALSLIVTERGVIS
jgi:5,10-methenyltetrahydrofolate synthetase